MNNMMDLQTPRQSRRIPNNIANNPPSSRPNYTSKTILNTISKHIPNNMINTKPNNKTNNTTNNKKSTNSTLGETIKRNIETYNMIKIFSEDLSKWNGNTHLLRKKNNMQYKRNIYSNALQFSENSKKEFTSNSYFELYENIVETDSSEAYHLIYHLYYKLMIPIPPLLQKIIIIQGNLYILKYLKSMLQYDELDMILAISYDHMHIVEYLLNANKVAYHNYYLAYALYKNRYTIAICIFSRYL